jgi:hypothetical protein
MALDHDELVPRTLISNEEFDGRPGIEEVLARVSEGEDLDVAFVMAEAINLVLVANLKLRRKRALGPDDMQNILRLWRVLIGTTGGSIPGAPTRRQ